MKRHVVATLIGCLLLGLAVAVFAAETYLTVVKNGAVAEVTGASANACCR